MTNRAWMVRAGSDGDRERTALGESAVIAGWPEVPDLSSCTSRSDIREILDSTYADSTNYLLGNWTGQLWRFISELEIGDTVVMPLKTHHQQIAIGEIKGPYEYLADEQPGFRHRRPVHWRTPLVSRESLGGDLLSSMGSLLTVCELWRHGAADRLHAVRSGQDDPGSPESLDEDIPASAAELTEAVPIEISIRDLIQIWGYRRRTSNIVDIINKGLDDLGLSVVPQISEGWIDSKVRVTAAVPTADSVSESTSESTFGDRSSEEPKPQSSLRYSVSTMSSAKQEIAAVSLSDTISLAATLMSLRDHSQLAVIDSEGQLVGAVTWESIATCQVFGRKDYVRDATRPAHSVLPSADLLGQIEEIYRSGFVFVRDHANRPIGIITAADLTRRFGNDHRPVVLIEEIERRLARRIQLIVDHDETMLKGINGYKPSGATTFSFGSYVTVIQNRPECWELLGFAGVEREVFGQTMEDVRLVRNSLMHFSPDPLDDTDLMLLDDALRFLRVLDGDPIDDLREEPNP